MGTTPSDTEVRRNDERSRYELWLGDENVGHIRYRVDGDGRRVFVHTEVDDGHQGEGLAGKLVQGALDQERAAGTEVIAQCPYVRKFFHKHPDYADVIVGELGPSSP